MKAIKLYQKLESDFITSELSDDWAPSIDTIADFVTSNFKRRSMGLVCDFAGEINRVFTAVFPTPEVLANILKSGASDALLFVHHPAIWDIRQAPQVFQQMDRGLLQKLKDHRVSIYNLHVPLDNYGEYSTSVTLARALGIRIEKPFAPYFGARCGVLGQTDLATVQDLRTKFRTAAGHEIRLYAYGQDEILKGRVAVVAGGGLGETIEAVATNKVNILVTGITAKNSHSRQAHAFAEENEINVLGGTHYSTEKFACMAMTNYFEKIGLPSEFIEGQSIMEDL